MGKQLLIKSLILLWFISAVIGNSPREKRDVHRIILKERRPRSHRSHHHRSHKHSHHHDYGSYENYGKRGKHYEDDNHSFEHNEDSYEDDRKYKIYRHRHHRKPSSKPHYSSAEYEDIRTEPHRGESSLLDNYNIRRKPYKESARYSSSMHVELTTKFPSTSPFYSFYGSTDLPSFNFNQKTIDLKPSSFATPQEFTFSNNTYEVRENHDDSNFLKDEQNFQVLAPMLELTKSHLADVSNLKDDEVGKKTIGRKRVRRIKVKN